MVWAFFGHTHDGFINELLTRAGHVVELNIQEWCCRALEGIVSRHGYFTYQLDLDIDVRIYIYMYIYIYIYMYIQI